MSAEQADQRSDAHGEDPRTITIDGAPFVRYDGLWRLDAVSISPKGRISLPRQLVATYQAPRRRRARLYWSRRDRAIAIVFVEGEHTAFPVQRVQKGGSAYIIANSFFTANDLQPEQLAARYRYEVKPVREVGIRDISEDHKACIVVLNSEPQIGRSSAAHDGVDVHAVRTWAKRNGYKVGARGRVPAKVLAAYRQASRTAGYQS